MTAPRRSTALNSSGSQIDPEVVAFLEALEHPLTPVVEAVRQLILSASPTIREGIKWNSPSFRTTDYFATLNLRGGMVRLILHTGAKVKHNADTGTTVTDPAGLLEWLAQDRAQVTFQDAKDFDAQRRALKALIQDWIRVPELAEVPRQVAKPTTIDEYLAAVSEDKRATLEKVRQAIRAAAPQAEECISYGLPAIRLAGHVLVGFGAAKTHCAFYPWSSATVAAFAEELQAYDTSKGTIRFPPDKPLSAALVRKLVKARIQENAN